MAVRVRVADFATVGVLDASPMIWETACVSVICVITSSSEFPPKGIFVSTKRRILMKTPAAMRIPKIITRGSRVFFPLAAGTIL